MEQIAATISLETVFAAIARALIKTLRAAVVLECIPSSRAYPYGAELPITTPNQIAQGTYG